MKISYKYFRWAAYVLEIIVLFTLQQTSGLIPRINGERPIILIPVLLTIAMLENENVGMAFGFFSGLLMDAGYGKVLGYSSIIMALLGYVIGSLAVNLIKTNLFTVMFVSFAAVFASLSLQFLFFFVMKGYEYPGYSFVQHYLPRIFYTILVTPIVYFFNIAFASQIKQKEN